MAGDMSIGCAALKRSTKLKSCTSGADTDSMHHMPNDRKENGNNTGLMMKPPCAPQNMRGGLRVYKIVILGDGGVGKSGKLATAAAPSVFLLSVFLSFSVLFFCFITAHFDCVCEKSINYLNFFYALFYGRPTTPNRPVYASCVRQTLRVHKPKHTHTYTHTYTHSYGHARTYTYTHQQLLPCSS